MSLIELTLNGLSSTTKILGLELVKSISDMLAENSGL